MLSRFDGLLEIAVCRTGDGGDVEVHRELEVGFVTFPGHVKGFSDGLGGRLLGGREQLGKPAFQAAVARYYPARASLGGVADLVGGTFLVRRGCQAIVVHAAA